MNEAPTWIDLLSVLRPLAPREIAERTEPLLLELPSEVLLGDSAQGSLDPQALIEQHALADARVHMFAEAPGSAVVLGNANATLEVAGAEPRHAQIEREPEAQGEWSLADLGSGAQTLLNGQRLAPHNPAELGSGSVIELGPARLVFVLPDDLTTLAALALRPHCERLELPKTGLLLRDLVDLKAAGKEAPRPAPGPESGPFLVMVPAEQQDANEPLSQTLTYASLAEAPRLLIETRVYSLALGADLTVGRDPVCDYVLAQRSISREHARFSRQEGEWRVVDLGSRNGTWLKRKRLDPGLIAPLRLGQPIVLGHATCMLLDWKQLRDLLAQTRT